MTAPGPAWRLAFVSASWTMRYTETRDARRARAPGRPSPPGGRAARRRSRRAPAGRRASAAASACTPPASSRSTPRTWRSSSIVWRPVRSTFSSIAAASAGRVRQAAPGGRRLDHHHADRVGDDVVELPGDPVALLGDPLAGEQVALALGALGPVGERLQVEAPPAEVVAEHEAGGEEADERRSTSTTDDLVVGHAGRPYGQQHDAAEPEHGLEAPPAVRVGAEGVDARRARPASSARRRRSTRRAIWPARTAASGRTPGTAAGTSRAASPPRRGARSTTSGRAPGRSRSSCGDVDVDRRGPSTVSRHGEHRVGGERVLAEPSDRSARLVDDTRHRRDASDVARPPADVRRQVERPSPRRRIGADRGAAGAGRRTSAPGAGSAAGAVPEPPDSL